MPSDNPQCRSGASVGRRVKQAAAQRSTGGAGPKPWRPPRPRAPASTLVSGGVPQGTDVKNDVIRYGALSGVAPPPAPVAGSTIDDPAPVVAHRGARSPIAPPAAAASLSWIRGPQAVATIVDSLERQLDHADSVEDHIRLLNAYTRAGFVLGVIPALAALATVAYVVGTLSLATLATSLLMATSAGGGATLLRFWLRRDKPPQEAPTQSEPSEGSKD